MRALIIATVVLAVMCALLVWALFYAAKVIEQMEDPRDPIDWERWEK